MAGGGRGKRILTTALSGKLMTGAVRATVIPAARLLHVPSLPPPAEGTISGFVAPPPEDRSSLCSSSGILDSFLLLAPPARSDPLLIRRSDFGGTNGDSGPSLLAACIASAVSAVRRQSRQPSAKSLPAANWSGLSTQTIQQILLFRPKDSLFERFHSTSAGCCRSLLLERQ
jgi:hypothetical protein